MVTQLYRNGTGAGERLSFPREPLLLTSVLWPFEGPGYDDVIFKYNVAAVRDLLDHEGAHAKDALDPFNTQEQAIVAAFNDQKAAITADPALAPDAQQAQMQTRWAEAQAQIDALLLDWAHSVIAKTIYRVDWIYADPPPDPAHPETFDCWDPQAVLWLAREGLVEAGASFLGPLSQRPMLSRLFNTTAPPPL